MSSLRVLGLMFTAVCMYSNTVMAASITSLGDLPGGDIFSVARDVSPDGSVVVGFSSSSYADPGLEAFRWTSEGGMIGLGELPGGDFYSFAYGVSADGLVVVGESNSDLGKEAFRWTSEGGMVGLGDLNGGDFDEFESIATDVSTDGSVVVGYSAGASGREAFRWTSEDGMVGLGDLPGGYYGSYAYGVSADGSVIVGTSESASGKEAFRWTSEDGMVGLGILHDYDDHSGALGVSADGSVVVGWSGTDFRTEAFRWTSEGGMVGLGSLPGGDFYSIAQGVSADGSVVIGNSTSDLGSEAFRWTSQDGMQSIASILTAAGVDLTGWDVQGAKSISADGQTIVGGAWIADLSEAPNGLWKSTGSMAEPRRSHAAALLNDGKVLVVGGAPGSSIAEIYNPNNGTFSSAGAMVYSHGALPTATKLTNGRVLIVGGAGGGTSAEIYDPVSGKFTPTGSMHRARFAHTASLLSDGRVLITGGRSPDLSEDLAITETYDPVTGMFTLAGTLNEARSGHTATLLKNGMVLIVAGSQITGPGAARSLASAELYDPVSGMFSFTGSVIGERTGHTSSLLSSGEVLIGGGLQQRSNIYDPVAGTFSFTGQMTTNRSSHIAVQLPSSTNCPELVLVAGGNKAVGPVVTNSAELYGPLQGIFSVTGSMNTPRQQFTATRMLDGRVLAVGGYDGDIDTSSAEIYEHECLRTTTPVDISGTVETSGGLDICALVLASGQYMFSCDPIGNFSLTGLPREQNGTVKRQIYADGFLPKIDILTGYSNEVVIMTRSGICPKYNVPYDAAFVPDSAGKPIDISGKVLLKNSQTPVCAIVLANGQYMFTCDGTGNYAMRIPLDAKGQFKLQVYADGFAPTIQTFDEFKTTNNVRMARASECQ